MWFIGAAKPRWRVRICFRNIYSSTYDHASKNWTNRRKTAITVIISHSGLLFSESHCLLGFVTTPACKGRSQNQKLLLCNVYLSGVFSSGITKIFCFLFVLHFHLPGPKKSMTGSSPNEHDYRSKVLGSQWVWLCNNGLGFNLEPQLVQVHSAELLKTHFTNYCYCICHSLHFQRWLT